MDLVHLIAESYIIAAAIGFLILWRGRKADNPATRVYATRLASLLGGIAVAGMLRIEANMLEGRISPDYEHALARHLYTANRIVLFVSVWWFMLYAWGFGRPRR